MLLDDFVKASVVELDKLGKVVDIGNNIRQVLLEQDEFLLARALLAEAALLESVNDVPDLALGDGDAARNLHGLDLLLGVDLFQLGLETAYEARLVVLGPLAGTDAVGRGEAGRVLELRLEAIVVNVVPLVLADDARPQLLAKLHDDDAGSGTKGSGGRCRPAIVDLAEVLDNQHASITGAADGGERRWMGESKVKENTGGDTKQSWVDGWLQRRRRGQSAAGRQGSWRFKEGKGKKILTS